MPPRVLGCLLVAKLSMPWACSRVRLRCCRAQRPLASSVDLLLLLLLLLLLPPLPLLLLSLALLPLPGPLDHGRLGVVPGLVGSLATISAISAIRAISQGENQKSHSLNKSS